MRATLLLMLSVLFSLPAAARAAETGTFSDAFKLYVAGMRGNDASANEQANLAFENLADQEPNNPVYLAYLGSTWAVKARDAWAPWTKLSHVEKSLDLLDRSLRLLQPQHDTLMVEGLPASVRVRSIAATTFIKLPKRFNRLDQGREILTKLTKNPLLASVNGPAKAYIYYYAGQAARTDGDVTSARALYRNVLEMAPDSRDAALARTALAEIDEGKTP